MAAVTGLLRSGTDGEKGQNHKGKTCDGNSGLSLMTGRLPPTSLTIFPPLNLNLSPYRLQPPTSNISQHASTFFLCLQPQTSTPPPSNALPPQPFPKPPPTSNLNPPNVSQIFYCARPLNPQFDFKGSLVDPPLRASNDITAPSKLARCPIRGGADGSSIARVQRGESATARCASTEDHQAP